MATTLVLWLALALAAAGTSTASAIAGNKSLAFQAQYEGEELLDGFRQWGAQSRAGRHAAIAQASRRAQKQDLQPLQPLTVNQPFRSKKPPSPPPRKRRPRPISPSIPSPPAPRKPRPRPSPPPPPPSPPRKRRPQPSPSRPPPPLRPPPPPSPRTVLSGRRLRLSPCQQVAASAAACRRQCNRAKRCAAWTFTRPFDCSHAGLLEEDIGVCYLLGDVVGSYQAAADEAFEYWSGYRE